MKNIYYLLVLLIFCFMVAMHYENYYVGNVVDEENIYCYMGKDKLILISYNRIQDLYILRLGDINNEKVFDSLHDLLSYVEVEEIELMHLKFLKRSLMPIPPGQKDFLWKMKLKDLNIDIEVGGQQIKYAQQIKGISVDVKTSDYRLLIDFKNEKRANRWLERFIKDKINSKKSFPLAKRFFYFYKFTATIILI